MDYNTRMHDYVMVMNLVIGKQGWVIIGEVLQHSRSFKIENCDVATFPGQKIGQQGFHKIMSTHICLMLKATYRGLKMRENNEK